MKNKTTIVSGQTISDELSDYYNTIKNEFKTTKGKNLHSQFSNYFFFLTIIVFFFNQVLIIT